MSEGGSAQQVTQLLDIQKATMQQGTLENSKHIYTYANIALAIAQISFGVSSVIGELGLPATNPVLFGFIREGIAGPILCIIAYFVAKRSQTTQLPKPAHFARFTLCGIAIFANQFCSIVGIKLVGAVTQAVWQPTQPIFSLVLAITLRLEKPTILKITGILLAFAGVAFMVLMNAEEDKDKKDQSHSMAEQFAGNIMFFINCLGTSVYVVFSKPLLQHYHSITVTGYTYIFASVFMAIACFVTNSSDEMLKFVCPPDKGSDVSSCGNGWEIPTTAILPLAYWIVFTSILAYGLITWGNKFVDASLVSAYTALQPVAASVVAFLVILTSAPPHYHLTKPGLGHLGVLAIFTGLGLVIFEARRAFSKRQAQRNCFLFRPWHQNTRFLNLPVVILQESSVSLLSDREE